MSWRDTLRAQAIHERFDDHTLVYHVGLRPAVPPEYEVPGLVGLTFRLARHGGRLVYATLLDLDAAVRLGQRLHLEPGEAIAMVDSHERIHVALQLAYGDDEVHPDEEERHSRVADWAWLSLSHPDADWRDIEIVQRREAEMMFEGRP